MAVRKIYIGSVGPYLYDDTDTIDDVDGDFPGETYKGLATDGNILALGASLYGYSMGIGDASEDHYLVIDVTEEMTADRDLVINVGDANRTITLDGDPTLDDWFDQAVKQASSPTFAGLTVINATGALIKPDATWSAGDIAKLILGDGENYLSSEHSGDTILRGYTDLVFNTRGTDVLTLAQSDNSATFAGNLVIPDAGYIGSASDPDAIQIDSSGNVILTQKMGINESSPAFPFDIGGGSPTNMRIRGDGAISSAQIILQDSGSDNAWYAMMRGTDYVSASDALVFAYNDGSWHNMFQMAPGDEVVFNEVGEDVDFRVEASGVPNALVVQGSDGGILASALKSGANQGAAGAAANEFWIDTADNSIKIGV